MNQVKLLKQFLYGGLVVVVLLIIVLQEVFVMYIMEGFLLLMWVLVWWLLFLFCLWYGLVCLWCIVQEESNQKVLLVFCGVFIFVFLVLKILLVIGSCLYLIGVGLVVIFFGLGVVVVLGVIVLLFQVLLLVYGGLIIFGVNGMLMVVIGLMVGYLVWKLVCWVGICCDVGVFFCVMLVDLMIYFVIFVQFGVVFFDLVIGVGGLIVKFMGIFCLMQILIVIVEGLFIVMIYDQLIKW